MYQPPKEILQKYADLLIGFALNDEKGIEKGDVVLLRVPEVAKPLLTCLYESVLKHGGHPIVKYIPYGLEKTLYTSGSEDQITRHAQKTLTGEIEQIDHLVSIIAEENKLELEDVAPSLIMKRGVAGKFYREGLNKKEAEGNFTRTAAMYGTEAMASEVGLSLEEYWGEIIKACYLDVEDPQEQWRTTVAGIAKAKDYLNSLDIERVHVKGSDVDLKVKLGKQRKWMSGSGRNIPSFEIFISPDWRGTEGRIKFNQPLYRYGSLVTGIELKFIEGKVVESRAVQNEHLIKEMISVENADKVGEFSLTDSRHSRITKFMGETLYDENVGGPFGNTHIALGMAYKDSYPGDAASLSEEDWQNLGYNDSVIHTDMISTTDRTVVATMSDGTEMVIYQGGKFTFLDDE